MIAIELKRYSHWLPGLVVAAVVVLAGARLITLSVHERAAQMRIAAESAVVRHARLIESQLQALTDRARGEAQRATNILGDGSHPVLLGSAIPGRDTFRMTATGTLLRAPEADAAVARALASEWASTDAGARAPAGVFGPVRYGSQWFAVAQAPIEIRSASGSAAASARSVVYENLDALLVRARFGRLVNEGYDFELSQRVPVSHEPRVFLNSRSGTLADPVTRGIHAPGTLSPASPSAYLELAVRPRSGWYPARDLASEIGLVVVLAWALAFGAHDLTHTLSRTRAALATARRRLHAANQRLVAEIEQHQTLQQSLEHARYHDPFTGLPNRRYFMDQLDRALRELRTRRRQRIAIVLIHIDRFTLINDTLGHTAGDELMLQAAQRFAKALEGLECVLARWGSEQLAVLVYEVESTAAAYAITTELLNARQEPFALRQHRIRIATRMGFTCIDSGLQRAEDALREADVALSVAKRHQNQLTVAYTPGMGGAAVSLVSLEADLHIALERNEFRLLFQPIVDLRSHRVVGAEALLRGRHPVEGLLAPKEFLAIAEESGVIVPVTRWIIQRVCRLAAQWRKRLPQGTNFYISVNLSAAVLRDAGLRDYVARVLEDTHTPPGHLKFELTEGGLISNVSTARQVLDALHGMGIELMLDDFGTGYSSLSYLQLFPFDYVKIDRPFVKRTGSERANAAITSSILQMASSLGLRAVAEVVETPAAAHALLQMGCHFAQGYFFSPAVEAEEALDQLRRAGSLRAAIPVAPVAANEPGQRDTASDTLVLADSPTLVLPDAPTLVLPAGIDVESNDDEVPEQGQLPESCDACGTIR
jgi:diguanylate cyclase (GGDEF)-like protein